MKLLIPAAVMALFGCSDATGSIQGGEQLFSSAAPVDAGAVDDAGSIAPSFCQEGGTNTGNKWKDIYACYFGPTGVVPGGCGSPGSGGACHEMGGSGSSFFLCPSLPDPTPCWNGLMGVASGGTSDPKATRLYGALRKPPGFDHGNKGFNGMGMNDMPLIPQSVVFQPPDLDRINAWIQGGALNN